MTPSEPERIGGAWARYESSFESPWNMRRVVHLHRRAAFAATWRELQLDLEEGPEKSVSRILTGRSRQGAPQDFSRTADVLAERAIRSVDAGYVVDSYPLKSWWQWP